MKNNFIHQVLRDYEKRYNTSDNQKVIIFLKIKVGF